MAASQPYTVACDGGLVKSANSIDLLRTPGVARELRNFEVSTEGGYRRINGYQKYGTTNATRPTGGATNILGVFPYADGVIVTAGTAIYFSNDGQNWLNIGRASVAGSGDNHTAFTGRSTLTRTGQGQSQFTLFDGPTYNYGQVIISDGANKPYIFRMEGTGALSTRTFFAEEITVTGTKHVKYVTTHDKHLIAAGVEDNLNTVYYSSTLDPTSFSGTGSGSIVLEDQIEGIKGFRNELFIFCTNSIFKLININDSSNIAIVPVTKNVGCLSGYSIQEIGGDLIFLAPDGLRTVAGTARIGDVELGTVSKEIQPLVTDLTESINSYIITSLVLREKSQYRLFYTNTSLEQTQQKGIIGTLRPNGFQWSETRSLEVTAIGSGFDNNNVERYYHGDTEGYIYQHDTGNTFDGSSILARYATPDYDYGDLGTLKTLHYLKVSASAEGVVEPDVQVRFDYGSTDIPQPPNPFDLGVIDPPSLFGEALFNTNVFGGAENPLIRVALQGSGHSNSFTVISEDTKAPYTINGLYINYVPSGRR
tara:strand:- start:228 stop:1835 length:1608 start_codon:yes stop_codon:yes gene_type:complete